LQSACNSNSYRCLVSIKQGSIELAIHHKTRDKYLFSADGEFKKRLAKYYSDNKGTNNDIVAIVKLVSKWGPSSMTCIVPHFINPSDRIKDKVYNLLDANRFKPLDVRMHALQLKVGTTHLKWKETAPVLYKSVVADLLRSFKNCIVSSFSQQSGNFMHLIFLSTDSQEIEDELVYQTIFPPGIKFMSFNGSAGPIAHSELSPHFDDDDFERVLLDWYAMSQASGSAVITQGSVFAMSSICSYDPTFRFWSILPAGNECEEKVKQQTCGKSLDMPDVSAW
jgi:hypothetical protein